MLKFSPKWTVMAGLLLAASPAKAMGSAGELMILVADGRRCSGLSAWLAGVYNESHMAYTLLVIVVIPALGLVMSKLTGYALARTGINLKSRVLAEH